jgi:hypothetical protein
LPAATFVQLRTETPAIHVPSNVAWTEENLAMASNGDAFRGSLLVKRCDHCHGVEGFSDLRPRPIRLRQIGQRSWLPLGTHSAAYRLASPAMVPSRP